MLNCGNFLFRANFDFDFCLKFILISDYFRGKLDSRKPNQVRKFNLVKDGMKFKVPYLGLHSIMKSPGVSNK